MALKRRIIEASTLPYISETVHLDPGQEIVAPTGPQPTTQRTEPSPYLVKPIVTGKGEGKSHGESKRDFTDHNICDTPRTGGNVIDPRSQYSYFGRTTPSGMASVLQIIRHHMEDS